MIAPILEKKCGSCKKLKSIEYFYVKRKVAGTYHSWCKPCSREHVKRYATDENRAKWRAESRKVKNRYHATRRNAAKRKHEFLLTEEEYGSLVESNSCHYCTNPIAEVRGGLDRKDTHGPYSFENCVPCCVPCNRIKGCALSYTEMLAVSKLLKELRGKDT